MYKADSKIAEEFINHQEILDTMSYAETHKSNRALIESLIDKAARCKGLTHREAALLLECDQPDLIERIFRLAEEIKHKFYGNRIVMFSAISFQLLCQWLRILSLSPEEQDNSPQEVDTRGD